MSLTKSQSNRYPDPGSAALSHFLKAKELKTNYINASTENEKNKLFSEIYFHEKKAEEFRRLAIRLEKE